MAVSDTMCHYPRPFPTARPTGRSSGEIPGAFHGASQPRGQRPTASGLAQRPWGCSWGAQAYLGAVSARAGSSRRSTRKVPSQALSGRLRRWQRVCQLVRIRLPCPSELARCILAHCGTGLATPSRRHGRTLSDNSTPRRNPTGRRGRQLKPKWPPLPTGL